MNWPTDRVLQDPQRRRALRVSENLTPGLAARMLAFTDDFRSGRVDRTLERLIQMAPVTDLLDHKVTIAGSPAAGAFWNRLRRENIDLVDPAISIIAGDDASTAESMLYLLVLDPLDPYGIGEPNRILIADVGLHSPFVTIRSLAAEYLFDHHIQALGDDYARLVLDDDARVRGIGWSAGIQLDSTNAYHLAQATLHDESAPLDIRRSALAALGTHYDTVDLVDTLTEFVGHPDPDLAMDAGNLLFRHHRHPTIATAAAQSQHQEVREIGEFLLDPYRGSPAAGGSRPGDPTQSDIFAEMMRQLEDRPDDDEP